MPCSASEGRERGARRPRRERCRRGCRSERGRARGGPSGEVEQAGGRRRDWRVRGGGGAGGTSQKRIVDDFCPLKKIQRPPAGPSLSKPEYKAPLRERCADGLLLKILYLETGRGSSDKSHTQPRGRRPSAALRLGGTSAAGSVLEVSTLEAAGWVARIGVTRSCFLTADRLQCTELPLLRLPRQFPRLG